MAEDPRWRGDWERKERAAAAIVEFLEGWVVKELCSRFGVVLECVFSETEEHRLVKALVLARAPMTLDEIAAESGLSMDLLCAGGSMRRVLERMEHSGLLVDRGSEGKPQYAFARGYLKIFYG